MFYYQSLVILISSLVNKNQFLQLCSVFISPYKYFLYSESDNSLARTLWTTHPVSQHYTAIDQSPQQSIHVYCVDYFFKQYNQQDVCVPAFNVWASELFCTDFHANVLSLKAASAMSFFKLCMHTICDDCQSGSVVATSRFLLWLLMEGMFGR